MRIDIVTDTYAPDINGVAMTLGHIVKILKERGHRIHVLHTQGGGKGETKLKSFVMPGYAEVRVGLPSKMRLSKRWEKKRPDAIYVATESPLGISALKLAKDMNIPAAAGFHTNFHQYMKRYKLSALKGVAMNYLKSVHDKANCTMTPSIDAVQMLKDSGFKNVHLLGRGVDTSQFSPRLRCDTLRCSLGVDDGTPLVIIVGRVAAEKNLEFSMKCIAEMKQQYPTLQSIVVGDGPARGKLQENYRDVHFVGMKTGADLARYYASADLMLFSSETETYGNVLLEAMASGLITVSYNYAASRVFIRDGVNGFHSEKSNEVEFLKKCFEALSVWDNETLKKSALAVTAKLSWESVVDTFEAQIRAIILEKPAHQQFRKPDHKLQLRSLFLSDIHLGCPEAKTREVIDLLKRVSCPRIYLNGDIIDAWALKRGEKWTNQHTKVIRVLLKKMEKEGTELIYLRGNHDDILERILPLSFGGLKIQSEAIHESLDGKKYLVVHGDAFDSFSTKHKWVAKLGAFGYDSLLKFNRYYNRYRKWTGQSPYSLSKAIKARVKGAVSFVEKYQEQVQALATKKKCDGIICGHIHTPADQHYEGVHYLNSGDWVETLSCVAEYPDGRLEVLYYEQFCKMLTERSTHFVSDQTNQELAQRNLAKGESVTSL